MIGLYNQDNNNEASRNIHVEVLGVWCNKPVYIRDQKG